MITKKSVLAATRLVSAGCLLSVLTACATATWKCEVGGTVNQQQKSGSAMIDARVSGELFVSSAAAALAGAMGMSTAIDSSAISMDVSGSTVQWPLQGAVTLSIVDRQDDDLVAARSFGWRRSANAVVFSEPAAIDAWLLASGANAMTHKVAYDFQGLSMPAEEGTNLIAVDIYQGGVPQATATASVAYGGAGVPGGPGCDYPVFCETP